MHIIFQPLNVFHPSIHPSLSPFTPNPLPPPHPPSLSTDYQASYSSRQIRDHSSHRYPAGSSRPGSSCCRPRRVSARRSCHLAGSLRGRRARHCLVLLSWLGRRGLSRRRHSVGWRNCCRRFRRRRRPRRWVLRGFGLWRLGMGQLGGIIEG